MEVNIDLSDCRKALDDKIYNEVVEDVIRDTTLYAEGEAKEECPVDTGYLMNSHSTEIDGARGTVYNSADYWIYVVFGTRYQAANDYPQRALTTVQGQIDSIIDNAISKRGL